MKHPDIDLFASRGPLKSTIFHAMAERDFTDICRSVIDLYKTRYPSADDLNSLKEYVLECDESPYGDTALHLACRQGHADDLKVMLSVFEEEDKHILAKNLLNQEGETLLEVAESENHEECIEYLRILLRVNNGSWGICNIF